MIQDSAAVADRLRVRLQIREDPEDAVQAASPTSGGGVLGPKLTNAEAKARTMPGPKVSTEEIKNRKLVTERWTLFKKDYKKLGFSRPTYLNAAEWMLEAFDDMPFLSKGLSDPSDFEQIGESIKALVRALKETPKPKVITTMKIASQNYGYRYF